NSSEVADEVARGVGMALRPYRREHSGDGDVVDVVAGPVGQRALLAPTRHPPVDEAGVGGEALVGADAEPLGDTRPEASDEHVTAGDQPEDGGDPFRSLQVDRHRLLSPTQ